MRISFRVPGYLYDDTDQPVVNSSILSALDGWQYEGGNMYNYIDMDLADQAVVGGTIRATWTPDRGLEVVTDYWAPDTLHPSYISRLRAETAGQLSDGIGEEGFEITLDGRNLVLVADTDTAPVVEQVYDGKPVSMPSRTARAARDGNMPLLEEAIASGELIDATIQGYSGLHLAILRGHIDAALLLISKGANPNLVVGDDGDETPLQLCALSNSLSDSDSATVARALLSHGADQATTTSSGHTAASLAKSRGKTSLLRVLSA